MVRGRLLAALSDHIRKSVLKLGKKSVKNLLTWGVFLVVLALAMFTNISTVLLVIAVGIFGVVFTALRERSQAK